MIKITHRYCQTFNNVSSTGVTAVQRFRTNGMYDPDQTGTGHQPMFFDQLAALYNHYVVIGSKITVKCVPSTSTTVPQFVGVNINDDSSLPGGVDVNTINEQPDSVFRQIAYAPDKPITITRKWSAKKRFGGSILANTELQGTPTTDPTEQSFFTLYNVAVDGASNVGCWMTVTIEYIAIWKELKDVGGS